MKVGFLISFFPSVIVRSSLRSRTGFANRSHFATYGKMRHRQSLSIFILVCLLLSSLAVPVIACPPDPPECYNNYDCPPCYNCVSGNCQWVGCPDTAPPTPNPATFDSPPTAVSDTEITMTATIGTDASQPVQYSFVCTAGGGHNRDWTTNPGYTDSGLEPGTQYTYTVQMRDSLENTGTASDPASATTEALVPNVVGMMETDASSAITDAGLVVGTVSDDYSDTVPAGYIISQNPTSGSQVPPGSPVNMVVSLGKPMVPDVVGMTQSAASAAITAVDNLVVGTTEQDYSDTVAAGLVISQFPTGGTEVNIGSAVDITISLGLPIVPDVVGQAEASAVTTIEAVDNLTAASTYEYSDTIAANLVISQNPTGGTEVNIGSAVDITISLGLPIVPDVVVGQTEASAVAIIEDVDNLTAASTYEYHNTVPAGNVISQNPAAGTAVNIGTTVNIVVSLGQPIVPYVVGTMETDASSAITNAGLVVGTPVTYEYSDTIAANLVISQKPTGGSVVPTGSTVDLVVSLGEDTPPAIPTTLVATLNGLQVDLSWSGSAEPDHAGYKIYRALTSGGPYIEIGTTDESTTEYHDDVSSSDLSSKNYYYVVTAIDVADNESDYSNEESVSVDYRVLNITKSIWYITIQSAIDNADNGDVIVATEGLTYQENLSFTDQKITLTSSNPTNPASTIIDGGDAGSVMTFGSGDASSVIMGFTIQNGNAAQGGGIYCYDASPMIYNCTITGGNADYGGGIYCYDASPTVSNCVITDNQASTYGGGMFCDNFASPMVKNCVFTENGANSGGGMCNYYGSSPTLTNCVFSGNYASNNGGGMYNDASYPTLINCTFSKNRAEGSSGGGMYNYGTSDPTVTNCIFWGNSDSDGEDESAQITGGAVVNYSCIQDDDPDDEYIPFGGAANGNTDDDPLFAAAPVAYWKMDDSAANPWVAGLNGVPAERVKNGTFDDDSEWVFQQDWHWHELTLTARCGSPFQGYLSQVGVVEVESGKKYAVVFDVLQNAGEMSLEVLMGGAVVATVTQKDKTYVITGTAGGANNYLQFHVASATGIRIRIDNIFCICLDDFPNTGIFRDTAGDPYTNAHSVAGKINEALEFDGTNDYVDCGNDSSLDITGPVTICAWLDPNKDSAYQGIVTKCNGGGSTNNPYEFRLSNDAPPKLQIVRADSSSSDTATSTGTVSLDDGWHHVAVTVDSGGSVTFYIDGQPSGTYTLSVTSPQGNNNSCLFAKRDDGLFFKGKIDDVMIFDRALSAEEIKQLYQNEFSFDGYHLLRDSPCINAGDPDYAPEEGETDRDGKRRIMAERIDMGAYEYGKVVYVDADASGDNNGENWTDAYNYLQDALNSTVTQLDSGDEIWVANGTYYPDQNTANPDGTDDRNSTFQLVSKVAIYGGFAGGPDGETSLDQRNLIDNVAILSGDVDVEDIPLPDGETIYTRNSYHVVTGSNNALLDGFTISGGYGYAKTVSVFGGGGVYCDNTSPVIANCTITSNHAKHDQHGGGLYTSGNSSPLLVNCVIAGNFVQGRRGGGIYHSGTGTLELINCTVANNAGDGIHCDGANADILVENCIVWQNRLDPSDTATYPVREIVLLNGGQAEIVYSSVELGQNGVIDDLGTGLTWGSGNTSDDPQVEEWGTWEWELADGSTLQTGANPTTILVDPTDVTIYDFKKQFAHMEKGNSHNEDNFVDDMLEPNQTYWNYKKPMLRPDQEMNPGDKSTISGDEDKFYLWYNPDVPGITDNAKWNGPINTNIEVPWICQDANDAVFRFDSEHFFPVDDWCSDPTHGCGTDPECLEWCEPQQRIDCYDQATFHPEAPPGETIEHNYFFTLQYHTKCTYVPGQILYFKASDDLFVAINNVVVMNRAGYYNPTPHETSLTFDGNGNVTVDFIYPARSSRTFGTDDGLVLDPHGSYDFDLFFAQRHTDLSVLLVERTPGDTDIIASFTPGDYHLKAGSPCIDVGDNTAVPIIIDTDIDSWPRFINDPATIDNGNRYPDDPRPYVDMGAYEFQVPIAVDDEYSIAKNSVLNIAAPGVLDNDEDLWSDPIEAILMSPPSQGSLTAGLNADGSFTYTPDPDYAGSDSFTYKAQSPVDGRRSTPATVTITVVEHIPVADAGPDQVFSVCYIDESVSVTLNGSASTDSGDDIVSYEWTWTENSEPQSATGEMPEVWMSTSGSPYEVTLTVTDSIGDTDTDTVQITIDVLDAPVAIPGSDFEVEDGGALDGDGVVDAGADVTLDGSGSTGTGLTYIWYAGGEEIAQGATPVVRLGIDTYTIGLLVIDECGKSDYADIVVTVRWPYLDAEIDAGEPQEIWLTLDGSEQLEQLQGLDTLELDPDNIITQYEWQVIDVPGGGYIVDWPDGMTVLEPHVTLADGITNEYQFLLIGKNSSGVEIDKDTTSITVKSTNAQPEVTAWILVGDQKLKEYTVTSPTPPGTVTIQGTITDDGQLSGELTGKWKQLSGPIDGVQITPLTESCSDDCTSLEVTATATFTQEDTYQLTLTGDDGTLSDTDVVVVQFESGLPPDIKAGEDDFGALDGGQVDVPMSDADVTDRDVPFNNTTQQWTLIEGDPADIEFLDGAGQPAGDTSTLENPTIRFLETGTYKFQLDATDAIVGAGTPDTVYVIIDDTPDPADVLSEWPMYHHDLASTGYSDSIAPDSNSILWVYDAGSSIESSPAVVDGVLYIGCSDANLYAIDAFTGGLLWTFLADASIRSSPAVADGRVYFLDLYGTLYAVDVTTHTSVWEVDLAVGGGHWSSPMVHNGNVFVATSDGWLHSRHASNGNLNWKTYIGKGLAYGPNGPVTVFNGKVYSGTHGMSPTLIALDETTGEIEWEYDGQGFINHNGVAVVDGDDDGDLEVYFGVTNDFAPVGWVVCLDEANGTEIWPQPYQTVGGVHSTPAVHDGKVFIGSSYDFMDVQEGHIYSLDAGTGDVLCEFESIGPVWSGPAIADGKVFFGDAGEYDHWFYAIDETTCELIWSYNTGPSSKIYGSPAVAYGNVYTADLGGTIFAFGYNIVELDIIDDLGGGCASFGDEVTYTISYNYPAGSVGDVVDVWIVDYLPDEIDRTSVNPNGSGVYDPVQNTVIWQIGTLSPGQSDSVTVSVKIADNAQPGLRITNAAVIKNHSTALGSKIAKTDICCLASGVLYVDQDAGGFNNGTSWEDAYTNLQNAFRMAARGCGSEIWVAAGTYMPQGADPAETFIVPDEVSIYGGFAGDEADISERDFRNASNETILSGVGFYNYVVTIEGVSTIDGFSVQGGVKAGILCNSASPTISHCYIGGNGDGAAGDAGIHLSDTSAEKVLNCIIYLNSGDGIYIDGTASPFIRNNTIAGNTAYGITNNGSGTPSIYNCLFWGNNSDGQQLDCTTYYCYIQGSTYTKANKDSNFNFGGDNPFDYIYPVRAYHLASDADCINEGLNEVASVWTIGSDETDIDGEVRIVGGTVDIGVDIGADEFPPIWVDAGDTIFEEIPVGATSVEVDFTSASVKSNGGTTVPTNLSYQWYTVDYPVEPVFVSGTDTEIYASATFSSEGWYLFLLQVMDVDNGNAVVGADLLLVRIDIGVEIVVDGKNPVGAVADSLTYEAYVDDVLNLSANFGPPSPLPDVQWWAPFEPVTIEGETQINATISFDTPGLYALELYALIEDEVIGKDRVWIDVRYPQIGVSAGPDKVLYLQKNLGVWEVSDQFHGSVDGINITSADRLEWSVEAADDNADLDTVSVVPDPVNPKVANITFGHYGAYYVLFSAWKNTSLGEVFLGTGVAATVVTYQQVVLDTGTYPDDPDVTVEIAPATFNLQGEIIQGQVDSVEWVFTDPEAPAGLVTFTSPKSWGTMVSFNAVDSYSGAGTYPITLLGKIRVNGEDVIVGANTVDITVDVTGGGDVFERAICITTENDDASGALPLTTQVRATIEESPCGSAIPFEDYDYAVWSWSGMDNSVIVEQSDYGVPVADVTFNRGGDYILTLVVKNGETLVATMSHPITIDGESCTISAEAGFVLEDMSQKVKEDITIGDTIDLYGQILDDCVNTQIEHYWSCEGSSDAVDLIPVDVELPDVQATVTFTEPGNYPLTLRVVNAQTRELLAFETIFASVAPSLFWLDISGSRIIEPQGFPVDVPLTATILGGAPAGSTCTWSTAEPGGIPPVPAGPADSGTTVTYSFTSAGTYDLTVTGDVSNPAWSQTVPVTIYVSQDTDIIWNAGSTKYVTLLEPAYMSDAVFVANDPSIVPKWFLVSGPAQVTFLPDDNSEKPYVVFSKEGQYTLSLVPWDLQTQTQVPGTDASTVYVFVDMPIVENPDAPEVTLEITDGPSNNLKILTATANDKDGVAQLLLKLGDETLAIASGAPAFNQDLTLEHTLDISHLPAGTSYVRAYAWDTDSIMGQSDQVACENNSAIRDFQVNPETINNFTGDDLIFTASFDGVPRTWELVIIKADGSSPAGPYSGEGDLNLEDGLGPVSTAGWSDGNYRAVLEVTDTGEVHFRIWRDRIYSSQVIADLNSFYGENSGTISLTNNWLSDDFILESGESTIESPIQVIKDGKGEVYAKLGHPDFQDDVEYRLRVCTVGNDNLLIPIQVITPFDVQRDAEGWAPKSSKGDTPELLGTVDLSMLENGIYYMELSVRCNGAEKYDYAQFVLDCPLKIGNVKFSQEDLVIETGGIPLRVVRTYDSFKKEKDGEFGHGWTYSIANLDIELDETRVPMYETNLSWGDIDYDSPISTRYGGELTNRNVTLTLPDGRRTMFMFYLDYHGFNSNNAEFPYYTAEYLPMPGIDAELRAVARSSNIAWENGAPKEVCRASLFGEGLYWEGILGGSGELDSVTRTDSAQYDFYSYILTTADGTGYYFKRKDNDPDYLCYPNTDPILDACYVIARGPLCLTRIRTADGEEIDLNTNLQTGRIGADGDIESKDAQGTVTKSLQIVYNNDGRIWYINAPSEVGQDPGMGETPTLVYEYDEGNLTKVKRLVNKSGATDDEKYDITEYVYDDRTHNPDDHYVTDIKDERGLTPIRYVYDAAGRLIETIDAKGNSIIIQHGAIADNGDKAEVVYERWDTEQLYPTVYAYNDRGNVTLVQKNEVGNPEPLEETLYFYEDPLYSDGPSRIEKLVPDPADPTQSVVAETRYEYDEHGKTTLTVDPLGNATIITGYDLHGNVLEIIQAKNYVNSTTYDTVSITRNTYEGNKLKTMEIQDATYARLQMTVNIYDGRNRIVKTINLDVDVVSDFGPFYNLQIGDPIPNETDHAITTYSYADSDPVYPLQPEWIEDPSGARTSFEYDQNGRQKYSYYKWTDPEGIQDLYVFTKNTYDDQGRVTKSERIVDVDTNPAGVEPETVLSETKYNSLGKVDFTIDQYNNVTKYEYDQVGNLVETRTLTTAAYNIGIDPQGRIVEYDSGGIVVQTHDYFAYFEADADTSHLTTTRTLYDTEGRAWLTVGPYDLTVYDEVPSEWPVGTETVYDVMGRVVETRRWAGVTVDLVPFKVESSGQAVPCQPDDTEMVGKMIPPGVYPEHAWDGTGTQPASIGWTSEEQLPVVALNIGSGQIGPLSYSRTVYDIGGRTKHSLSLDENGYEQPTTYLYDTAGKQTDVIDPVGHSVDDLYVDYIALYDGTLTARKIDFDSANFDESDDLDPAVRTTTLYDGMRRSSITDARGNMTSFQYDALGRVEKTTYPFTIVEEGGASAVPTYSHAGYDGLGRKAWESQVTIAETSVPNSEIKDFDYDVAGRLIATELPDPDGGVNRPIYRYVCDERGNMVGILDPLDPSRLTVFEYDELNHQTAKYMPFVPSTALPANPTAADVYVALQEALGWAEPPKAEYRDYDLQGRLERHTDYAKQDTGYFYNSKGQLKYKKYYEFVDADPVDGENDNYPDNPAEVIQYTYDNLGRKETVTDSRGTTTYVYGAEGRIESVITPEGTVNYTYDPVTGRKGNASTASGNTNTNYFYDKLGRLAGTGTASEDTYYHYDEVGNRQWLCVDTDGGFDGSDPAAPTGYEIKTDYTYDQLNRLDTLINSKVAGQISSFDYAVAADGMRKQALETLIYPDSTTENQTVDYTYDNLNHLTGEDAYDDATPTANGYNSQYTYDLVGNRLTRGVTIQQSAAELYIYTEYEYDDNDRLLRETHTDTIPVVMIYREDGPYYAHITGDDIYYTAAGKPGRIGQFKAFLLGLPSAWNQYLLFAVLFLVPVLFLLPVIVRFLRRLAKALSNKSNLRLSLYHRCMSVLLAYVMLISPVGFQSLAQGATAYSEISTLAWGQNDRIIEYGQWDGALGTSNFITGYDDNGSVTEKLTYNTNGTTSDRSDDMLLEEISYEYNLQNRLETVTTDDQSGTVKVIEYKYNTSGIRVSKHTWTEISGIPQGDDVTVIYLADAYNHTGYAQTLEELTFNMADPVVGTDTPDSVTTYTIGDDVIAQNVDGTSEYLLYDGHGSTRQLVDATGGTVVDSYSYDAYGVMLGTDDTAAANADTSLLYAGEQYDSGLSQYYLRARYYNQNTGRFNRMDPFSGSQQDPQSLHKYLYCHANPVNSIDPTGMMEFSIVGLTFNINNQMLIRTIDLGRHYWQYTKVRNTLKVLAIASVITSAMVTTYVDGSALLELPFNRYPLLSDWPDLTFSWSWKYGGDRKISIKSERSIDGGGTKDFTIEINFTHPELSSGTFAVSASTDFYDKYPIKASVDWGAELSASIQSGFPIPAFTLGIGLKLESGWEPLGLATSFSLVKYNGSNLELLWWDIPVW